MGTLIRRPAVEYNLAEHCNLKCAGCDHASPWLPERFAELETLRRDLSVLSEVMHATELKLLGGEPLLHPRLGELLVAARSSGIADRLTLVTNGVLLHRVEESLLGLIDRLWISRYPNVSLSLDKARLKQLSSKHGFELHVLPVRSFRHTLINRPHDDNAVVREVYRSCRLAHRWSCHTVHDGRYFKCPPAAFLQTRLGLRGARVDNRARDGVQLHDNPDLHGNLVRYLARPEPLEACSYCLGTSGKLLPHRQLRNSELRDGDVGPAPAALLALNPLQRLRLKLGRARGDPER